MNSDHIVTVISVAKELCQSEEYRTKLIVIIRFEKINININVRTISTKFKKKHITK